MNIVYLDIDECLLGEKKRLILDNICMYGIDRNSINHLMILGHKVINPERCD